MKSTSARSIPFVLLAFLLSGAAALIYEVTWTRALALVLGSTTYAVSTMLATFMSGLALGAALGGKLADRSDRLLLHFGLCELGIGLTGLVSVPLIYLLPATYLAVYRAFHLYPVIFFVLQILLCALVMLVPTTLMGATFPLVSRAITARLDEMGTRVGHAYSFNTVGAVAGSLAAGFLLIPALGLRGAALTAGAVNLLIGLAMVLRERPVRPGRLLACLLLVPYLPAAVWAWTARHEPSLLNFYSAHRHLGDQPYSAILDNERFLLDPIFDGDYAEGRVTAFRKRDGRLLLQVSGKVEGTAEKDVPIMLLLAYLPMAAHERPQTMLVIGLGAGVTLAAAKEHLGSVDLVEINPGVLEAMSRFGDPGLLDGVRVIRNDARNFLLRTPETYDLISSAPSYPSESMVANLSTREYFKIAATRLGEGGIFCHWMPYYMMTNADVTMMMKTFASVFPHASLWKVDGSNLILLGRERPFAVGGEEIIRRVTELNSGGRPLGYVLSRDPVQIAEIARREDVPLNTDDRPILEFRVAGNFLLGDLSIREREEP